ncbi:MAG: hypothetical protein V8S76_04610 [Lachnospiraceae bacterium]
MSAAGLRWQKNIILVYIYQPKDGVWDIENPQSEMIIILRQLVCW